MLCGSRTSAILRTIAPGLVEVEQVSAVFGDQAVDDDDLGGAERGQPQRQVGADEAAAAGDEDARALESRSDAQALHSVWNAPSRSTLWYACAPKKSRCA